jgi:O-acetylserine/cysteine efflux transporter
VAEDGGVPARHVLLALAIVLVWGLNFVAIHWGLDDFPPLLFAALRFTLVAVPAVFLLRRPPIPVRWIVLVGLFMSALQFGLLFVAMDAGLPAGLASLVVQLQVFFTMGVAVVVLRERPGARRWAGAAIAFAGIAVIAMGRAEDVPLLGVALGLASAASWGVGNICTRFAQAPDALALVVWSALVAPLPLLGLSLAFEGPAEIGAALESVTVGGLLALLYVVVLATMFGHGAWMWLLRRHEASIVAPFTLLVPIVGIGAAWALLGERPNGAEVAGAALVLAGLATAAAPVALRRRHLPAVLQRHRDPHAEAAARDARHAERAAQRAAAEHPRPALADLHADRPHL